VSYLVCEKSHANNSDKFFGLLGVTLGNKNIQITSLKYDYCCIKLHTPATAVYIMIYIKKLLKKLYKLHRWY